MNLDAFENIDNSIHTINNCKMILDSDIALLYGVETKRINEAVKNNPDKFPSGYIIQLTECDLEQLRSKISTTNLSKTRYLPKGFTEKGLYMLATILKSPKATKTTIAIIETFAKIKELNQTINTISETNNDTIQKSLIQKSGELMSEIFDGGLNSTNSETTIEINLAVIKLKHTIKRK